MPTQQRGGKEEGKRRNKREKGRKEKGEGKTASRGHRRWPSPLPSLPRWWASSRTKTIKMGRDGTLEGKRGKLERKRDRRGGKKNERA